jgi:hypothetical protein
MPIRCMLPWWKEKEKKKDKKKKEGKVRIVSYFIEWKKKKVNHRIKVGQHTFLFSSSSNNDIPRPLDTVNEL